MKSSSASSRCRLASAAFALLFGLLAVAHAAPLPVRGFRGLMWGDPPSHLGPARRVSSEGGVQCFERERENLLFGDAALQSVRFCFRGDALVLVQLAAAGTGTALRSEFERGYGAPDQRTGPLLRWGDPRNGASAELSSADGSVLLQLRSPPPQAPAR